MGEQAKILIELRSVIHEQLELLRIILYVMSEGPVTYHGQPLTCLLEKDKARATAAVSMGAGQSLTTILNNSAERGISVRDLYPIARAVVEGFINAAFFTTQPLEVSQRALSHRDYAAWKHDNRVVGTGEFMFTLGSDPNPRATAAKKFPEFSGKGRESWSSLDAPSKIERVGKVVRASGGALLGAYAGIYAVSSEIIHGSVYGMSYFVSAYGCKDPTTETFLSGTEEQMIDILSAVGHAASGFVSAFANVHKFGLWFLTSTPCSNVFSRQSLRTTGLEATHQSKTSKKRLASHRRRRHITPVDQNTLPSSCSMEETNRATPHSSCEPALLLRSSS